MVGNRLADRLLYQRSRGEFHLADQKPQRPRPPGPCWGFSLWSSLPRL